MFVSAMERCATRHFFLNVLLGFCDGHSVEGKKSPSINHFCKPKVRIKSTLLQFCFVSENMTTCLHGTENHRMTYIKHYPFCNTCNFDINKEKILLLILLADKFQITYLQQFHHIHSNLLVQP